MEIFEQPSTGGIRCLMMSFWPPTTNMVSEADNSVRENLIAEAKRVEEDGLYSSKGHYAAADFWRKVHLRLGVPTAILTSIAGVVIIAAPASFVVELIFGLVTLAGGVSTGVMVFLSLSERAPLTRQLRITTTH